MMVMIVFGFVLLVLAVAVIVLFAMVGQLAGSAGVESREPDRTLRAVQTPRMGQAPGTWPASLAGLEDDCVLLVLSTVCTSCAAVAAQLSDGRNWADLGIVISTGGTVRGTDWVAEKGLGSFRHYLDDGGQWTGAEFGVRTSPCALIIRDGVLVAAYIFHNVEALRERISSDHKLLQASARSTATSKETV
jgi:hypothetical protein